MHRRNARLKVTLGAITATTRTPSAVPSCRIASCHVARHRPERASPFALGLTSRGGRARPVTILCQSSTETVLPPPACVLLSGALFFFPFLPVCFRLFFTRTEEDLAARTFFCFLLVSSLLSCYGVFHLDWTVLSGSAEGLRAFRRSGVNSPLVSYKLE